jgi:ethanolamine utilization protein EutP (predicted NTPase)
MDGLEKSVVATLKQECSFRALSNATKLPNSLLPSWLAFVSCKKPSIAIVGRIRKARDMTDRQSYPQISSCLQLANLGSKLVAKKK